ncbi:MAG: winged helix-turn-helix transcriptional regulator [Spirochaetales bacterium]|nr:winged helix-turn-helix transcriptional regulator [Spirochaetales bacterium]
MSDLSPSELALLEALHASSEAEKSPTQRKLAKLAGLSVGMTNLLLKRMIKMGYVKVSTLNGRTLKYILTPDGLREKVNKSYHFLVRSINYYYRVKEEIEKHTLHLKPGSPVAVIGDNELARLARDVLEGRGLVVRNAGAGSGEPGTAFVCDLHWVGPGVPLYLVGPEKG